jgi:hypothetical protein
MAGIVPKEKTFSMQLIWMSIVLQVTGALFLTSGTIVAILAIVKKMDGFNWVVFLLSSAILSANLGLVCLVLGYRKRSVKEPSLANPMPAFQEPGFRRSTVDLPETDNVQKSTAASSLFSNISRRRRPQLKIVK